MKIPDREDAVARALDILPKGDAARSDPRFIRNGNLAEEARVTRETAVDVWLTVSPLTAAPAEILENIMAKIPPSVAPPEEKAPRRSFVWTGLTVGGWAAALVFAGLWMMRNHPTPEMPSASSPRSVVVDGGRLLPPPSERLSPRDRAERERIQKLHEEIARLRTALTREGERQKAPVIKGLSRPGSAARSPEEARQHLQKVLIDALRSSLEAETGAPGDSAVLVIERGWPSEGITNLMEGETIRHRNFPESHWQELGLLKSEEGNYYDPATGLIWSPDPEGRGFIGRPSSETENLEGYRKGEEVAEPKSSPFVQAEPSGFLIENPENASIDVVIEGAKPALEGETQWLVWTLPDGTRHEQLVDAGMYTPGGTLLGSMSFDSILTEQRFIPNSIGGEIYLEFQTRSQNGAVIETILQGGK